jgi:hypothetical protein
MRAVFRAVVTRLLAAVVLLAACGAPPEPLPTAPPPAVASAVPPSSFPSALPSAYPAPTGTVGAPTYPAPTYPARTYPALTYPAATLPAVTPITTSPQPSPAPSCVHGPTAAQVIAVVRTRPGIPTGTRLDVKQGPFCAGEWQFTVLGQAGKTLDQVEPLLVVTTGRPSALRVVEAGADVCSSHVESEAPSGIRVLACGA